MVSLHREWKIHHSYKLILYTAILKPENNENPDIDQLSATARPETCIQLLLAAAPVHLVQIFNICNLDNFRWREGIYIELSTMSNISTIPVDYILTVARGLHRLPRRVARVRRMLAPWSPSGRPRARGGRSAAPPPVRGLGPARLMAAASQLVTSLRPVMWHSLA